MIISGTLCLEFASKIASLAIGSVKHRNHNKKYRIFCFGFRVPEMFFSYLSNAVTVNPAKLTVRKCIFEHVISSKATKELLTGQQGNTMISISYSLAALTLQDTMKTLRKLL
jgi:hypothetical protein